MKTILLHNGHHQHDHGGASHTDEHMDHPGHFDEREQPLNEISRAAHSPLAQAGPWAAGRQR